MEEQDFASASQGMAQDVMLEEFLGESKELESFFDDLLPHVGWDVPEEVAYRQDIESVRVGSTSALL